MMLEEPFFYWELRTCHQFLQGENEHANLSNGVNRGQVPVNVYAALYLPLSLELCSGKGTESQLTIFLFLDWYPVNSAD